MNEAKGLTPMQQCSHGEPLQWCDTCLWPLVKAADALAKAAGFAISSNALYIDDAYCGLCSASFDAPRHISQERLMNCHDDWCPALAIYKALATYERARRIQ